MTAVLVDTSVWRRHFAGKVSASQRQALFTLLDEDRAVLIHPAVIGELVLGGLSSREERLLERLPPAAEVPTAEILSFVKHRKLARKGIGWIDAQLLASTLTSEALLWTFDRNLSAAAGALGVCFEAEA